jgi:dTDP-4-amino-4,6-dideoxy-D-galactose acyltransferase
VRGTTGSPSAEVDTPFDVLDWDSARFGFTVARVRALDSLADLPRVAEQMRRHGIALAYYSLPTAQPQIPRALLTELGGRLVDTRVTFGARLVAPAIGETPRGAAAVHGGHHVSEYHPTTVGPTLIRLARESGAFSRFRVDPRIAPGVFEAIYDAWIRRSVRREIADDVLVAKHGRRILGLVTVKANADRGEIGLLSVDGAARGRGIGTALVFAAHDSMVRRGCTHSGVATQRANRGACGLYESSGYIVERLERVYHFWL